MQAKGAVALERLEMNDAVIVVTDEDYRSITLPCNALEEGEGPVRATGPARISRAASR